MNLLIISDYRDFGPIQPSFIGWNRLEKQYLLTRLAELALEIGHTPTERDLRFDGMMPHRSAYIRAFKGYNNAIKELGLKPNKPGRAKPSPLTEEFLEKWGCM